MVRGVRLLLAARPLASLILLSLAYLLGFLFLEQVFGIAAGVFYLVVIAYAARLYGAKVGVAAGALEFPVNFIEYLLAGYPMGLVTGPPAIAMSLACVLIGFTIGRMRDLQVEVREEKVKLQHEAALLRRAENRIETIGAVTNDVIWEYQPAIDRLWFSPPFYGRYGQPGTEDRWPLSAWWSLVHPEDQDRVRGEWARGLELGRSQSLEFRMRRLDGGYDYVLNRWLVVRGSDGIPATAVGAMVDVTTLKEAERTRSEMAAKEREIVEMQDTNRLHSNLLNVASHELNTPLAAMKLAIFVHRQAHEAASNMQDIASLDLLDRNVVRLADLIRNTLDVSRLRAGRISLHVERIDFAALVRDSVAQLEPLAQRSSVSLESSGVSLLPIEADKDRVFQVLFNLIGNALKFTPGGGRVYVTYRGNQEEVWCEVRDTGLGLEQAQIQRLFQPFTQVHQDLASRPGAGLGLYISRGIIEEHGGRLWCTSDGQGKGSTFTFRLPLKAKAQASKVQAPEALD